MCQESPHPPAQESLTFRISLHDQGSCTASFLSGAEYWVQSPLLELGLPNNHVQNLPIFPHVSLPIYQDFNILAYCLLRCYLCNPKYLSLCLVIEYSPPPTIR